MVRGFAVALGLLFAFPACSSAPEEPALDSDITSPNDGDDKDEDSERDDDGVKGEDDTMLVTETAEATTPDRQPPPATTTPPPPPPPPPPRTGCTSDTQCNDNYACTTDRCVSGKCVNTQQCRAGCPC